MHDRFQLHSAHAGTLTYPMTVTDTNSGLQKNVTLIGTASPQAPAASPSSLTFGNIQLGNAVPMSFTVMAPNGDPVMAKLFPGGNSTGFTVTQGASCLSTPCTVTVLMAPNVLGCCTASVQLSDPVTGQGSSVYLTGTAGLPIPSYSSQSLTFPLRAVGSTSIALPVNLTNIGNANLTVTSVTLIGTNTADFIQTGNCVNTIAPNNECSINISFAPISAETRTAAVQIISNSLTSPDLIQLSGTAQ